MPSSGLVMFPPTTSGTIPKPTKNATKSSSLIIWLNTSASGRSSPLKVTTILDKLSTLKISHKLTLSFPSFQTTGQHGFPLKPLKSSKNKATTLRVSKPLMEPCTKTLRSLLLTLCPHTMPISTCLLNVTTLEMSSLGLKRPFLKWKQMDSRVFWLVTTPRLVTRPSTAGPSVSKLLWIDSRMWYVSASSATSTKKSTM